jgi:hypothetical protein
MKSGVEKLIEHRRLVDRKEQQRVNIYQGCDWRGAGAGAGRVRRVKLNKGVSADDRSPAPQSGSICGAMVEGAAVEGSGGGGVRALERRVTEARPKVTLMPTGHGHAAAVRLAGRSSPGALEPQGGASAAGHLDLLPHPGARGR